MAQGKILYQQNLPENKKILQAKRRMFYELKYGKLFLYFFNITPLIVSFFLKEDKYKLMCSAVAFALTLLNEFLKSMFLSYKEKAILLTALYESNITNTALSKIEYDREITNDLYELSIRKSDNQYNKIKKNPIDIPDDIPEKYAYLYISRVEAAQGRYLASKVKLLYGLFLVGIAMILSVIMFNSKLSNFIYQIVCIWNLIIPLITIFVTSSKNMKHCVKISSDIDNYFADGDRSRERLSRFNGYIQSLMFEYRYALVIIPSTIRFVFRKKLRALKDGVTIRFYDSLKEIEIKEQKIIKANAKQNVINEVVLDSDINTSQMLLNDKLRKGTTSQKKADSKPKKQTSSKVIKIKDLDKPAENKKNVKSTNKAIKNKD